MRKRTIAKSTWIALRLLATILAIMAPALAHAQTRMVTASWDANTDQYTTGYRLYWGTSPTAMTSTADAGKNTSRQLTLATGTTYYFVVRGYNVRGVEGPPSNQAQLTLSATAPTATFTATLQGTNTAVLNWQTTGATTVTINGIAVALSGSGQQVINTATTYTLVATGAGGSLTRVATVVPNSPPVDCVLSAWSLQSATPWGLCTGGQQSRTETWVRSVVTQPANGGAACGPLQEDRIATQACTAAPTAPGIPVNMRADVSGWRVRLSWSPEPTGGAPGDYLVSVGLSPGASNLVSSQPVGNVTSVEASAPHGEYYARVKAQNSVGTSADSAEVAFRIGSRKPPRQPGALTGSLENGVATLSWSVPAHEDGASPSGYLIEAGSGPGLANLASVPVGDITSFQAGSVPPGVYYVRLRAMNDMGLGDPSNEIVLRSAVTVGAPQALTESGQGNMVQLDWQAPLTGNIPAGYVIEAGSGPGLVDLAALRLGNVLTFATTAPPGVYYVRVRAVGADGIAGEASNEIVVRK